MARSPAAPGDAIDAALPYAGDVVDGKYRIERVIGEGGMGVVLQAHHVHFDQRVALKVLTARDDTALSRFSIEARSTARLRSEHVARVMDVGTLPSGLPFLVLEYLEGCDLAELLELGGRLPVTDAVDYVMQALEGLAQAHGLGIVHRDLKPANLFLAVQPSGASIIKILDFGISKSIASRRSGKTGSVTGDHATLGSPRYMSPEQIRSTKNVDARTDIWSIGVVLYELLAGQQPYTGESFGETFAAILEKDAPSLGAVRGDLPVALVDAVDRCMQRDRTRRWRDVHGLAQAIAPFGGQEAAARVQRIASTLRNAQAVTERDVPSLGAVRVVRAGPDEPTADPPSERAAGRGYGQVTAGHAAFTSDTPKKESLSTTVLSYVRRAQRRAIVATTVAIAAFVSVGAGVVVLQTTHAAEPASVAAPAQAAPAKLATEVASEPAPAETASATAPAPPSTGSTLSASPPPIVTSEPSPPPRAAAPVRAAPRARAVARPPPPPAHHAVAPPSPKKRPSVLDSPD